MKHSIKTQLVLSFAGLIAVILGLYLLVNNLFLERFYVRQKEDDLIRIYNAIDRIEELSDYRSSEFEAVFRRISGANNVDLNILWVSEQDGSAITLYQSRDNPVMRGRIEGYLFGLNSVADAKDILIQTDAYRIQKFRDSADAAEYLEAWGKLQTGCFFLMRIPIESIKDSVKIANKFALYIMFAAVALSLLFVWWISKRITDPIRELTAISRRMANLEFDARYMSGGQNEIGELGEHFNHMSEILEETISELKTANNELKRDNERKTQIDEMRKEFLSNVSHELKTPIALIQGYAEGLREGINDDDAQSRDFYCEVIMDEASKMNNLVKKLLNLNQLEFGSRTVDMARFDLTELLSGVAQSVSLLAEQKGVEIRLEQKEPLYVWGDEFIVEQVITNYLSNALNHVSEHGHIEIRVLAANGRVRVGVYNTGQPIPEEELEKIWIKFYKVDKARTREYGGSGIGLSIVKAAMESMNQPYGVFNCEDGVCFWFELEDGKGEQGA